QFTSLFGRFHHITIPTDVIDKDSLIDGFPKLDGSSIQGFTEVHESDLVLKPDPNTFAIVPWSENKTARMICEVYWDAGKNKFPRDPRVIARKAEELLKEEGFKHSYWGPEAEFFVFNKVTWDTSSITDSYYSIESEEITGAYPISVKNGYMPEEPLDTLTEFRNECSDNLYHFGIICEDHHHEVATGGQCELSMRFDELVNSADNIMTYKYVIKYLAKRSNMVATFMPKPLANDNGTGMHINTSLWADSNLFYDENDQYAELSQTARYFIGGLLEHASSLAAIAAPTTNSYRRLIPGFEAPVYIAWSRDNRSAIVRIPAHFKGMKYAKSKRIELRLADPSCNPYLCFSAVLAAGLDGIKKKIDAMDPIDEDIYKLSAKKRRELGIKQLPPTLNAAADALESDNEYLKPIFDNDVIDRIIEKERNDANEVSSRPHPHEFHLYFDI
ncbi:MAG: type I glutamate--ammonia ligase, partial [Candidatus Nitrosothermus koennekii]